MRWLWLAGAALMAGVAGPVRAETTGALTCLRAVPFEFIYPETPASEMTPTAECTIIACQGEFEPGTFAVLPQASFSDVTVAIDPLVSREGNTLSPEAFDVRVVKVWPQHLARTVQMFPELLVTQDDLTDVHLRWRQETVDGQAVLLRDAPEFPRTLQTSLEEGKIKQFWVTAHIPEDQAPGIYRGVLRIRSAGNEISSLPLKVCVLPTRLSDPKMITGIYLGITLGPRGGFADAQARHVLQVPEREFRGMLQMLKDRGIESVMFYDQSYEALDRAFAIAREVGLKGPLVQWFFPADEQKGLLMHKKIKVQDFKGEFVPFYSPEEEAELVRRVELAKKYGYEPWFYGIDEIPSSMYPVQAEITRQTRQAGGKIVTAMKASATRRDDLFDWANYSHVFIPATEPQDLYPGAPEQRRSAAADGTPYGRETQYWGCQREAPLANRMLSGFHQYRTGLDGIFPWGASFIPVGEDAYHESLNQRISCFIYPEKNGGVPTLQSEALREGIDDVRYIRTVLDIAGPSASLNAVLQPFSYSQVRANTLRAEAFVQARLALVRLLADHLKDRMPAGMYDELIDVIEKESGVTTVVHFPTEGWITLRSAENFVPQHGYKAAETGIASGQAQPQGTASIIELTQDSGAALVHFNLSMLPKGVEIEQAELRMFHFFARNTGELTISAHRVTSSWNELEATWTHRTKTHPWANPGGDYDPTPLDTQVAKGTDTNLCWDITDAVKAWYQNPEENHGILLKGVEGAGVIRLTTSETKDWRWKASFYVPALHLRIRPAN